MYFGHVDGGKAEGGKLWRGIVDCGGGGGGGAELAAEVEGEEEVLMVDVVTASGREEVVASSGNAEAEAEVDCWTDAAC